jgi:hypothetical protein
VLSNGTDILVSPHSGPGEDQDQQAANPTGFLLMFGMLKTDVETVGIIEVLQRADTGPNTRSGYLRFLSEMCRLAGDFLKSHQLRHFSHRQVLWTQLEEFARTVHASLDSRTTAFTIANEGRRLIECDRLSVAVRKGNHCVIEAISGQDLFDKRSNYVRLLGRLATAVVASGDPMWYTGDTRDMPPQVEEAVQEYVDEAHSKTVGVLPLRRPTSQDTDDPNVQVEREPPIGALIVEQIEDSRVPASLTQRVDVVCQHSSTALANAKEHQDLFLMPVWRALGKSRAVVKVRSLPITLSVLGGVLAVALVLGMWPAKFQMEAKGTLEPVLRQDVFASIDGVVEELYCKHDDKVVKDQVLAKLRNNDLGVDITGVIRERDTARARLMRIHQFLVKERGTTKEDQRLQLLGEQLEEEQKIKSAEAQLAWYKAKEESLLVKSPLNGTVVTWDLRKRLINRPVQRGQSLLSVADPDGPWQLEIKMPDNHIGPVVAAQGSLGPERKVSYMIFGDETSTTRYGTVSEVHGSAEVHGEEGSTVLIKVKIDKNEIPNPKPGMTVTAKVDCGRRPLGYVLLYDVIAFIQAKILFKFF